MSNEALAIAIQQGDSDALAQLWEQVKDYAYTVVMRYAEKPYAETEDYLQTSFLGVRAAAYAFDPSRGSFLTVADWYIRRACSQFYRWHKRGEVQTISYDVPYNPDDPADGDYKDVFPDESLPDPWEAMEQEDMRRNVRAAVGELAPRHQEVIKLQYFQGQAQETICKEMGISACRVWQIKKSAFQKLRNSKHLRPYRGDYAPHKGISVRSFYENWESAVERVAIKNVDAERRYLMRNLQEFEKHVQQSIASGYYTPEIGQMVISNYKASLGLS